MKIENFEDFEDFDINWYEGINLNGEQLFNFIDEYKSYYDIANKELVVKIRLWNGLDHRSSEKIEDVPQIGKALEKINFDITCFIVRVLRVIKTTKEYEGEIVDLNKWAEEAERRKQGLRFREIKTNKEEQCTKD